MSSSWSTFIQIPNSIVPKIKDTKWHFAGTSSNIYKLSTRRILTCGQHFLPTRRLSNTEALATDTQPPKLRHFWTTHECGKGLSLTTSRWWRHHDVTILRAIIKNVPVIIWQRSCALIWLPWQRRWRFNDNLVSGYGTDGILTEGVAISFKFYRRRKKKYEFPINSKYECQPMVNLSTAVCV